MDFVEEIDSELAKRNSWNGVVQVAKRMLEEIHQLEQGPAMIPGSQALSSPLLLALLLTAASGTKRSLKEGLLESGG